MARGGVGSKRSRLTTSGDEAENFQAVGVRLRECLISFIVETANDDLVPVGDVPPQGANFRELERIACEHALASGNV